MAQKILEVHDFVASFLNRGLPLVDTRSESEFSHARIPGAVNIPLLNNEERKIVGTIYKQKGRDAAVLKGFELVGPRFHEMIRQASAMFPGREIMMYCWRGGMRSGIMSWLLETAGFRVYLLKGGYKAFRNWVSFTNQTPRHVMVLGGHTGSGKTEFLQGLKNMGEQVIDLEELANHKGSAFGALGRGPQPSNEQFENLLALEWVKTNPDLPVWIENESRSVGSCILPENVYNLIRSAPLIDLVTGFERRKNRIRNEYTCFPIDVLSQTTEKIKKRLGPQHTKTAIEQLEQGNFDGWLEIVIGYYDKLYEHGTSQRDPGMVFRLDLSQASEEEMTSQILNFSKTDPIRRAAGLMQSIS